MKIHCKYSGIKGFVKLYEYGLKWRHMITEKANKQKVLRKPRSFNSVRHN